MKPVSIDDFESMVATAVRSAQTPSKGPGAELKRLLARFGITATAACDCHAKAEAMDQRGCDWCEEHIDEVVAWLRQEAHKRGLPFLDTVGRILVRKAIALARANG